MKRPAALMLLALLAACGNKPRQPDWLVNADSAQDRFERAYLSGRDPAALTEFERFRHELAVLGNGDERPVVAVVLDVVLAREACREAIRAEKGVSDGPAEPLPFGLERLVHVGESLDNRRPSPWRGPL